MNSLPSQVPYETGFLETDASHKATATASAKKPLAATAVALLESRSHATLFLEEDEEEESNVASSGAGGGSGWNTATLEVPSAITRVSFASTSRTGAAGSPAAHHAVRLAFARVGSANDALAYDLAKEQDADPLPLALEVLQDHVDKLSSSSGSGGRQEGGEWDESTDAATSKGDEGDSYANDDGNDDIALLVRELQTLKLELELERTARKAQDEHIEAMQMEMNTKLNTRDLEENLDIILAMHQSRPQSRPQSRRSQQEGEHKEGKEDPTSTDDDMRSGDKIAAVGGLLKLAPGRRGPFADLSSSPALVQLGARGGSSVRLRKGGFDFGFSKITGWIEKSLEKFKKKVVAPLRKWFEKAIKTATKFLEGMINVVKKALEKAKNWLKGLIEQVKRSLDKMVDAIKSIIDKVKQALQKAKNWLKGLIDKLANMVKELVNKLKEALHKAKEWLKGLINELKKKVVSLVDAIKKKLKEAKDWLLGIINKLKDKIMKVVKDLIKTVKGWVDKALSVVYKIKLRESSYDGSHPHTPTVMVTVYLR